MFHPVPKSTTPMTSHELRLKAKMSSKLKVCHKKKLKAKIKAKCNKWGIYV